MRDFDKKFRKIQILSLNMQQNVRIKISCQNLAFDLILLFEIWVYVKSFYNFLYITVFKDHEKLS